MEQLIIKVEIIESNVNRKSSFIRDENVYLENSPIDANQTELSRSMKLKLTPYIQSFQRKLIKESASSQFNEKNKSTSSNKLSMPNTKTQEKTDQDKI